MNKEIEQVYKAHSQICKSLANEKRLKIIQALGKKTVRFGELARIVAISPTNLAQHLLVLKSAGVVENTRTGKSSYYRLSDTRILAACNLMRDVLLGVIKRRNKWIDLI